MFICVSTKTGSKYNENANKLEPVVTYDVHFEDTVDPQLDLLRAGDDRVANLKIFNLEIDDNGVPSIGSEVVP